MTVDAGLVLDVAGLTALASGSVSLWTLRVTAAAAGRKLTAAVIAGVESLLFALAFAAVLTSLQDPVRIGAYAVGVAAGTLVGLTLDERLSTGQSLVRVVVDGAGDPVSAALRAHGWPATRSVADGVNGAVAVLTVAVDDRALPALARDLDRLAPHGFRTVERLRHARPTELPIGMHQPGRRQGRSAQDSRPGRLPAT